MKIPRVYLDTSIFGGVFDIEFKLSTVELFKAFEARKFIPVVSILVEEELQGSPLQVREFFAGWENRLEIVSLTEEVVELRNAYIQAGILTKKSLIDASHVALATVAGCPLILSWNFKHIVNYKKIPLYNGINKVKGYPDVGIYSPMEVIDND